MNLVEKYVMRQIVKKQCRDLKKRRIIENTYKIVIKEFESYIDHASAYYFNIKDSFSDSSCASALKMDFYIYLNILLENGAYQYSLDVAFHTIADATRAREALILYLVERGY